MYAKWSRGLLIILIGACGKVEGGGDVDADVASGSLTVTTSGSGTGFVTSDPAGISCGNDCSESFAGGAQVTLTATPASGSTLAGWQGACSGAGVCSITINGPTTVTAVFSRLDDRRTITVTRAGTGNAALTSAPAGIDCGSDCEEVYVAGTDLTLTAAPAFTSRFDGWNGGTCTGNSLSCRFIVTATATITATFTAVERSVGWPMVFASSRAPYPNFLTAYQITVPATVVLARFGIIGASFGSQFKIALYTDNNGSPGTLVAQGNQIGTLGAGEVEIAAPAVTLAPGSYWVARNFADTTGSYHHDGSESQSHKSNQLSFSSALPQTFTVTHTASEAPYENIYIVVRQP